MPHACRLFVVLTLGSVGLLTLAGCVPISAQSQDKTLVETVSLEPNGRLALEAERGSVRLTSWDNNSVDIRARIEPPADVDADTARRAVEETTIEVRGSRRSVRIRTDYGDLARESLFDGSRRLPRVHYDIRAPRQLDLDLEIDRAETTLTGFEGRLLLNLDRSNLTARDLAGTITLEFNRGALKANDVSGSIALNIDRGQPVMLDGVRGSLDLDLDRTNVTMRHVELDGDSHVEIDRGDLDLQVVRDQALTIDANVPRRAKLSVDPPVTLESSGDDVRGTINGGGPTLRIDVDRGNVRVGAH
ncbi:MAG: hypothetical protein OSB03_17420 [Vicinamibacterales bacterium]|nr:hypothetical protein [Vicinamibacterales bacterium]